VLLFFYYIVQFVTRIVHTMLNMKEMANTWDMI